MPRPRSAAVVIMHAPGRQLVSLELLALRVRRRGVGVELVFPEAVGGRPCAARWGREFLRRFVVFVSDCRGVWVECRQGNLVDAGGAGCADVGCFSEELVAAAPAEIPG